jgi:hypothetical protein
VLTGISPNSIVFADRPVRAAGHVATAQFLQQWDEDKNSFFSDPPNATVSVLGGSGSDVSDAVVVLTKPVLDGTTLTFDVTVLEGSALGKGPAAVFIDDFRGGGGFRGGAASFTGPRGNTADFAHVGDFHGGDISGNYYHDPDYQGAWYRGAPYAGAAVAGAAVGAAVADTSGRYYGGAPYYGAPYYAGNPIMQPGPIMRTRPMAADRSPAAFTPIRPVSDLAQTGAAGAGLALAPAGFARAAGPAHDRSEQRLVEQKTGTG